VTAENRRIGEEKGRKIEETTAAKYGCPVGQP